MKTQVSALTHPNFGGTMQYGLTTTCNLVPLKRGWLQIVEARKIMHKAPHHTVLNKHLKLYMHYDRIPDIPQPILLWPRCYREQPMHSMTLQTVEHASKHCQTRNAFKSQRTPTNELVGSGCCQQGRPLHTCKIDQGPASGALSKRDSQAIPRPQDSLPMQACHLLATADTNQH